MINKSDYNKALKTIEQYNIQTNKLFINELICICCRKNKISPLEGMSLSNGFIKASEQDKGCWKGGSVSRAAYGYGSKHDLENFFVAICDECTTYLKNDKLIVDVKDIVRKENNLLK